MVQFIKRNRTTPIDRILIEKEELADNIRFCDTCGSEDPLALPRSARKEAVLREEQEDWEYGIAPNLPLSCYQNNSSREQPH